MLCAEPVSLNGRIFFINFGYDNGLDGLKLVGQVIAVVIVEKLK